MKQISRRTMLGALAAAPLAMPAILRAQSVSKPIKIGLLSDVAGPYSYSGGPGSKVAAEMAVADFGGSLLGRPISVIQADNQNKPDIASALARQWIDAEDVTVLMDGASSASALAIQQVTRERKRIYLITSPLSAAMVGKSCSPYGFQFVGNTYSLTKGIADTLTRQGGGNWFILAVDYDFGYALQAQMEQFIVAAGGKVVDSTRAPLGNTDYSSQLIRAQSSRAKVIGLGLGGADLQNCIKQAAEFGIAEGGQVLATPFLTEVDVFTIGQENCRNLMLSTSFYWDSTPQTREANARFSAKTNRPMNMYQAAAYSATKHWLKAAQAVQSLDADAVAAKMRDLPVNDFFNDNVRIQENGSVPVAMYLYQVKRPGESKEKWDVFDLRGSLPSPQAYPPPNQTGCPLVRS